MRPSSMAPALAGLSFMLTVIWGGPLIRVLRHYKIGDVIQVELREQNITKTGTPTMGGVLFVLPVLLITGLLNAVSLIGLDYIGLSVLLPLGTMIGYAILGAVDDWEKVMKRRREGLGISVRLKFLLQLALALVIAYVLRYVLEVPQMFLPGVPGELELGFLYIPVAMFVILSSTNAINITDGMDGLAGLISATAFATYGGIAMLQGQVFIGRFCFTIVGALFGFLWFNVHPAQMIMGDTGSMPLGGTLAVIALMTGQWALLPVIAIIPVSEVVSVILQVNYYKLTKGKRIFKMAPFHFHFKLSGWSETQVVQRFWLVSLLFAMVGIALAVV